MRTSNIVFVVRAEYEAFGETTQPQSVQFSARVPTKDDAVQLAATFPKAMRVKATTLSSPIDGSYLNGTETFGLVVSHINLMPTANNGVNETGIKRYRRFSKLLDDRGFATEWTANFGNSYNSEEEFQARLAN